MGEGLVGLGHLVGVLLLLDRVPALVGGVHELAGELVARRLSRAEHASAFGVRPFRGVLGGRAHGLRRAGGAALPAAYGQRPAGMLLRAAAAPREVRGPLNFVGEAPEVFRDPYTVGAPD